MQEASLLELTAADARERLVAFVREVVVGLPRVRQRDNALLYVRGLVEHGGRKSLWPTLFRLGEDAARYESLQQFLADSPWEPSQLARASAERVYPEIGVTAWVVDDTGIPKDGTHSPGVKRQYSGTLGKIGNCQVGVSVSAVLDEASCPLDWRLFLPEEWDKDEERRKRCRVPKEEHHRPKWQLALEMLDELSSWGLEAPVVVADAGYGEITEFREALAERGLTYVLQVKGATSVLGIDARPTLAAWKGRGRPPVERYGEPRTSLREQALAAGEAVLCQVSWREGSHRTLGSRFLALRVRPANVKLRRAAADAGRELEPGWLLAEWPLGCPEPVKYWLSNLPEDTLLEELAELAKVRWRIEQDYRELKDALGLDHFEGRSYPGWHHHVTLVSAAHAFLTLERRRHPWARAVA